MSDIRCSSYKVRSTKEPEVTIGIVSDLHDGDGRKVLSILRRMKPDLILLPGDILERYDSSFRALMRDDVKRYGYSHRMMLERAAIHTIGGCYRIFFPRRKGKGLSFLKEAASIAPVYYAYGNHEAELTEEDFRIIQEHNIHLLDNTFMNYVTPSGRKLCIGGLSSLPKSEWLKEYEKEEGYHILMSHHPEYYDQFIKKRKIELTVSGHAHGGQIRIKNKAIYAPGQGLFPKYTRGIYENRLLVSSGLSNNGIVPRWGNPMEVLQLRV